MSGRNFIRASFILTNTSKNSLASLSLKSKQLRFSTKAKLCKERQGAGELPKNQKQEQNSSSRSQESKQSNNQKNQDRNAASQESQNQTISGKTVPEILQENKKI